MQKVNKYLKKLNLLYVEDEKNIRETFFQLMKKYFRHVYVAKNGKEGLEVFESHKDEIDIIITDIEMPKKDGLSMIKEIKKIKSDIPTIFTTAFQDTNHLKEAIDIGVDGYIIKPIDINKLISKLNYIASSLMAKKRNAQYIKLMNILINNQKTGVILLDEDFNILLMNKTIEKLVEDIGIVKYKHIDDILLYCYDEEGKHIDSEILKKNISKTLICHSKKTEKYYEIDITKVESHYIIDLDDITEYKQKENEIKEIAMIDELTQIYNRKKIEAIKEELINSNICIIMFDIDNFKQINDTYGHLKGDKVLQSLSSAVKHHIRSSDIFIRWGGEEFVVLLQKLDDIKVAYTLAEKLRKVINELEIKEVKHFSCSFGVSCGSVTKPNDIKNILNKADKTLYKAKRNGKNRVEIN